MIRHALFADIPRLIELFKEGHARSRFASFGMDVPEAKSLLVGAIQRREVRGPGGACVNVAERDGALTGFVFGLLDRCYHVGVPLMANDVFLYATRGRGLIAQAGALVDAYTAWWKANPRVIIGNLSWTDFIASDDRLERLYERKGYRRRGAIFGMER